MSSPQMMRRLEAVEGQHGVNQTAAIAVIHRPNGIAGADLAAWKRTEDKPDAALVVIIRCWVAWPPRTVEDVQWNLDHAGLHKSPGELAMRIRACADYPERAAILSCLPEIILQ